MAKAQDVALFFIDLAQRQNEHERGDLMTNLRLQKLLYFAQGCNLQQTGKPLFDEQLEAWKHGPVVPSIYRKYKCCGKNPIECTDDDYDPKVVSSDEFELLIDVYREYGQYAAWMLRDMTHKPGSPWDQSYKYGNSTPITLKQMTEYFTNIESALPRFEIPDDYPVVDGLPADWYDPEEDAEWEGYEP